MDLEKFTSTSQIFFEFSISLLFLLNIDFKNVKTLKIMDASGRIVKEVVNPNSSSISLENLKYDLTHRRLTKQDLYTVSNEVNGEEGTLTVHHGTVLVIQSKDEA